MVGSSRVVRQIGDSRCGGKRRFCYGRVIFLFFVCLGMREDVYRVCGCESLVVVN